MESLVDFAFTGYSGIIKPLQEKTEILGLLKTIADKKPATVLEIGTAIGGNLFLFCSVARPDATIISLDLPGGKYGGGYPLWRKWLYRSFPKTCQRLFLVRANSHLEETRKKIAAILKNREIDFLFIDGDHTYEGVKQDFNMYTPFVKKGGLIAFHDIAPHSSNDGCGVDRYWQEIKTRGPFMEFIRSWNQGWAGIGLIEKQ
ncbi:MAG: hypothetical protein A2350_01185 [Candidatus Raymondbacteria bacterium RifOxyB12_full_50_8]|uniref:Methyltransferase n=1 Tax=Candidatus Raymondbacteria bacterium RIFOXYD12_FULL_49_13 TaxID=1817890 RepID=A0A1F7F210_UNCRA|nr:MAG: hypothetical protein A2248_07530 [Candidatus Raymondbacteria bacterium RIFOXYA2_FULL_49_16]OGJ88767.1 MAG: hypothetical protein A2350_01185 [Candidatus Raymondbacteria bacterium RifOxyB12_full_50_8]OGJ96142.1 MAG: hypothetical protein A2453_09385 [Candidatus Raymondbacteria bacterium RIFOXYC2_FULL_50_21]OGK00603.1 MAG: hypothetical protein A2519_21595 [Candidatus Raymondbacteria bacterium RIFOXYD12_FULL_49_13]OGP41149.1 MAG: hypothetical protein A2324_09780 [Candidatus Raymondbacteria b